MSEPAKSQAAGDGAVVAGRGALFIGFAKAFFMASGFLQNVLLTRIVGVAEFGAYSVVTKYVSIVNNAVVQSTIQSVSKFTAEEDGRAAAVKRAGLRMQAYLGTAIGLAFFLGAPFIADVINAPGYAGHFRLVALIPFLYAFYAVFVGSANGLRRFRAQAGFDVGFSTAKTILVLGGAAVAGVSGALGGFVAAAAVILVVAAKVMGMPGRADAGDFPSRRLFVFMGEVVAYGLVLNLALNYDLLLLRRIAGAAAPEAAGALAGNYEALRTLALLPYQALIVITFVIFPLVSRSTFSEDRAATTAYVTQSLRYALILAGAMGVVLAARPGTLLALVYPPQYGQGATALPVLVTGQCCLALTAVACAILNAAGLVRVALALVGVTVAVGAGVASLTVAKATPGSPMLVAMAAATSAGMAAGFVAALVTLRARLGGGPPPATLVRVCVAIAAAVLAGRFVPGSGKVAGLVAIGVVGVVYAVTLLVLRELGADDRAKVLRILRRR